MGDSELNGCGVAGTRPIGDVVRRIQQTGDLTTSHLIVHLRLRSLMDSHALVKCADAAMYTAKHANTGG